MMFKNAASVYLYIVFYVQFSNASPAIHGHKIERIDIIIDSLRLSNVFYGSSELARLHCESDCWSNSSTSPFLIHIKRKLRHRTFKIFFYLYLNFV